MPALNDGGPAYPMQGDYRDSQRGASLLDYFAAQLAAALLVANARSALEQQGEVMSADEVAASAFTLVRRCFAPGRRAHENQRLHRQAD